MVWDGAELALDPGFAVEVLPLQAAMARSATTMAAHARVRERVRERVRQSAQPRIERLE
jgi:hypothetical protein